MEQEYLSQLTNLEKKVLEIAKDHLGDSFDIERSIGYKCWTKNKNQEPSTSNQEPSTSNQEPSTSNQGTTNHDNKIKKRIKIKKRVKKRVKNV